MQKIKSVLRKNGLKKYDKRSKLTENEEKLKSLIEKLGYSFENEDLNKIGQYSYFSKNFAKLTRGPVINLFIEIPFLYKKFRRSELSEQKNGWNYTILEDIVLKDDLVNRRLHSDEQAFLLTFINTLVQKCYKVSKIKSRNITHSYFQGYNDASHCVIGVDESTDFHLVDLLAMHSLTDYELSSVTYSGDIMQRLTKDGIRDWGELKTLIKKIEVKELLISYRQSPTLLEIASSIYNRASGKNAEYISCMDRDEMEPKPLFFKSNDEGEKIEWISKRILEIYNAYGNTIPSIAVFLSDESQLEFFADKLGETDRLADVGITVKACNKGQVLGDSNMVRVFSVEYIKGLEFEAVFYHNLDNLLELAQEDTTIKNLYVGLSRASFYMAITSSSDLKYFSYLEKYFNHNQQNWI
jgi:hypothetical protein